MLNCRFISKMAIKIHLYLNFILLVFMIQKINRLFKIIDLFSEWVVNIMKLGKGIYRSTKKQKNQLILNGKKSMDLSSGNNEILKA